MASSLTKASPGDTGGKTFFGHPRGLATLFMTEMWERFSFYGMRALLVLYLIAGGSDAGADSQAGGLAMRLTVATAIYSVYNAMVYLLAMPGGWFGDRVWGPRKTVAIAGFIIIAGHLCLAVPLSGSFFIGLGLVALGSGLLKANISTMVGQLYDGPNDPRRDGGFTIFYMGINVGAFLAPLAIGTVGETVNWHLGFALAAVGMALGLAQYLYGYKHLPAESAGAPKPLQAEERTRWLRRGLLWLAGAAVFYLIVVSSGVYTINWVLLPITFLGLIIPAAVLIRIKRDKELDQVEQGRMSSFIWFFAAASIFWMIYDQGGSTVQAFGSAQTTGEVLGIGFPSTWFQSLNPLMIMALAPVFAAVWLALARRRKEPTTASKFSLGLIIIGVSFLLFTTAMLVGTGDAKVSPMWLVGVYFLQTVAELCLSPVGLSLTTKLAPAKYASQMMGVFFLAVTTGDCITSLVSLAGVNLDQSGAVATEATLAVLAGLAVLGFRRSVNKTMGGIH